MRLDIYQVDAFAKELFEGNPAAVCPLEEWLPDEQMQQIAMENNLSETAFFVQTDNGFHLRWFTPTTEVDLCGHATLATAHVIFEHLNYPENEIHFNSRSGELIVKKEQGRLKMNFPAAKVKEAQLPDFLEKAIGVSCQELYRDTDLLYVVESEQQVRDLNPDIRLLAKADVRGVIVTALGNEVDFVSRFFAPNAGVDEDPVTGSAHTMLIPYWSEKLGKKELIARQISQRGGTVYCTYLGERVQLAGEACTFLEGKVQL
ncbi:PhzF family phenazine biosynthesis protein [Fodinibius saliphilus]|uniref:PhzF family phenazine biosynthesis protein n=1 Tax=Fodinibius saliphilus TaxID=1920650 RepID=UPI00110819E9|nr:PhzF family phenazine biosynthesis protein [Fodinibius saliphilus]